MCTQKPHIGVLTRNFNFFEGKWEARTHNVMHSLIVIDWIQIWQETILLISNENDVLPVIYNFGHTEWMDMIFYNNYKKEILAPQLEKYL